MFGTKRPSITSTWSSEAPALSTVSICAPSRLKSAERIDGAISIIESYRASSPDIQYCQGQGVGADAGGRRLPFAFPAPRFVFPLGLFEFRLRTGVSARFTFSSPDVARFALVFRFRFAERFAFAFELSLPFLLAGFRFGLLSFEFGCEIVE